MRTHIAITFQKDHITDHADGNLLTIEGVVSKPVKLKERGAKDLVLTGLKISSDAESKNVEGKLLVRTKKINQKIGYGDLIKFKGYIRRPKNYNNPGSFDYVMYLRSRGIHATSSIYNEKKIIEIERGYKKGVFYYLQRLRENVHDFIYENGFSVNKKVVAALLFGSSRQINRYAHNLFLKTGTSHILAISGLHMGIVALFFYHLTIFILTRSERFALEHNIIKLSYLITLIILILYSLLIGMRVSSVRAVIMIGVYILSVLFDRAHNTLRTMFVAAFFILLIYPASLYEVSFLLSFTAVFATLYFYPKLNLKFDRYFERDDSYFKKRITLFSVVKSIFLVFTLSVVINLVTIPIILYNFNHISLTAPLLNAIVIPIYSIIIIPLNFVIFLVSLISTFAGRFFLHVNEYMIHLTIVLLKFLNKYLNYPLYTATPSPHEIVFYYGLLFCLFKLKEKKYIALAIAFFTLLISSNIYYTKKPFSKETLTVNFIDVGHGESFLLEFPNGEKMLVDGGGSSYKSSNFEIGRDVVAKFLWKKKIDKLDYIVSTHPHPDHMGGLFFIASHFASGNIFIGKYDYENKTFRRFIKRFKDKIEYVDENNSRLTIGGATVEFLNYDFDWQVKSNTGINRSALVMMLKYEGKRVLLTSDIDHKTEDTLIKKGAALKSDVLKIAHHGSRGSTSERFLKAVSPEFAVISIGRNNYNLPNESTLELLNKNGIKLFRTDHDGMITLTLEESGVSFTAFLK